MEMEVSQSLVPEGTSSLTIQVSQEQESAMEAFFQINSWQLIKEVKGRAAAGGDGSIHSLTIRVTSEQEAAMEAFFQINNWTLIKEVDSENVKADETTLHIDSQGQIVEPENVQPQQEEQQQQQQQQSNVETLVEEVQGLHEVQVTAQGANGQPQIITVYTEGGNAQGLPDSLLTGGSAQEGREIPQVIIQEITLPEGMSLDQGLVIANPHPSIRRVTPRGSVKPGDKIHKCHVCGKTFKQAQSFNGHYQSHFGAKPYQCEICHTGFTLKAALVAHHSIHTGAKPFTCSLCNKGFRRKDDMISHIRTHTGEKPYECDICGKKFKYRNQIPKHRRAHTGEKPYKCDVCGKCFTSNIHLRRHERTHTGERPYKCTVCPKAFTQYGHLQAHMRIHTDERPFECSVCGRGFREKKVMKKHETLHTSERPYKCDVCGKGFLRQSNLELHAVMHQKESKDGVRVRPRPRSKKQQPDAEMREFVASVLCNVKKVDSGMQTDNLIHGVPTDDSTGADNLSAFVNFAVEQQIQQGTKIEPISDIQNAVTGNDQYTLVMQDDGSEGYLIANYDGSAVAEEIVTMSSQQVEISTGYEVSTAEENVDTVTYDDNPSDIISKALEKAVGASHAEDEESSQHGFLSTESQPDTNIVLDIKQEFSEPTADLSQGQSAGVEGKGQCNENLPEGHGDTNTTVVDQFQTPKCKITLVK